MDAIEGMGSIRTWANQCEGGNPGSTKVARRSVSKKLVDSGFVDFTGSSISALAARLEMQLEGPKQPDVGLRAMCRLLEMIRSEEPDALAWAQSGQDNVRPDRAASLLR